MGMIDLNTGRVRHRRIANELTIPSKNNIASTRLTPIEMTRASYTTVMGQVRWRLVIISGCMVPVHGRLGRGDGVEHPWWELLCGPHLSTYCLNGNAQSQPHADLSTPGTSSNDKSTGNERVVGSVDQIRVIRLLLHSCHGILRADAGTAPRRGGGERPCGLFGIGLRPQRYDTCSPGGRGLTRARYFSLRGC